MQLLLLITFVTLVLVFAGGQADAQCVPGEVKFDGCIRCKCQQNRKTYCRNVCENNLHNVAPNSKRCKPGEEVNLKCKKCICQSNGSLSCEDVCPTETYHSMGSQSSASHLSQDSTEKDVQKRIAPTF